MPLLGGLFAAKRRNQSNASTESSSRESSADHTIYNIPAAASSSKLKLAFRRKPPEDLPPPPRKSSLFGGTNDSIHSLSNDTTDTHKKQPGKLFSWSRERTKSKPNSPPPPPPNDPSFSLVSFRHISADSSPPSSHLPPPRPRPQVDRTDSDSSQRMSIAAFREAQARSRAPSPAPSLRPQSVADTFRLDPNGRKRASTVSVDRPLPNRSAGPPTPIASPRPGPSAHASSNESEDEDVDSDGEPIPKLARKRTITRPSDGIRARSDIGHASPATSNGVRHVAPIHTNPAPLLAPRRPRASVSTSAVTPSGAARTASILAAANSPGSHAQSRRSSRTPKHDSDDSADASDADSEDLPLSDLVAPRRPGSSASNCSNSRPRMPAKPLIDINSLAGGPPLLTPILRHENSVKDLSTKRKEQDVEKDQPFSIPAALAFSSSSSPPISPSMNNQNAKHLNKPPSVAYHRRSSSDVPVPAKSEEPDNDEDLMNAIRLVGSLDKQQDQPSGRPNSSDRIVPTPIRAREPPTSFTVLSRPPHRQSTTDSSASLSPASQTRSIPAPSAVPPQLDIGARKRASTVTKSPVQADKSDAVSVVSASRSSMSRSSSRIPPLPLIHSIPDSPSVKEDYKPGRSRPASRASAVHTSEGRAQPLQIPPVPAVSPSASNKMRSHGYQPALVPQRPFASNISVRGESPAGSSTGDSSSGRAPFTPRDGSDIDRTPARSKDDVSDVGSTLKARGHAKKLSVTFEDSQPIRTRERAKTDLTNEQRTRERRRSEAKAAIELGKIVNGRGPLVHDDSDDDMLRGRNPAINATMENSVHGVWGAWQQPMATGMAPMVPSQFGNDPAYLAAHQRALLIAKQAYQMAVAQHAMQVAGEEWERSSNAGFGSGGSVYGGSSGESAYGGGNRGSLYGGGPGMGMMGMPNMGMLMPPSPWARSSVAFPSTASVYGGISSSQSECGGVRGWDTRSVYGESFGPPSSRLSQVGTGAPSSNASAYGGSSARPRASTGVAPSSAPSKATTPGKAQVRSRAAPPSSWKSGR